MRDHITRDVSTCSVYQKQKKQHKKYGLLLEKEAEYKTMGMTVCQSHWSLQNTNKEMWSQNTRIKVCHDEQPSNRLVQNQAV